MNSKIILENPGFINVITFYKNINFCEEVFLKYLNNLLKLNIENKSLFLDKSFKLRYNIFDEIDYTTIEIWLIVNNTKKLYSSEEIINKYLSLNINLDILNLEIFCNRNYIICNNNLNLIFSDVLLYNIFYKKVDEIRYIYSDIKNNEFITNFLKHIIKFDIYYSKILNFYKKFSLSYPNLQKSNFKLINDYSKIIEGDITKLNQNDLIELNKKINNLQAVNFGLMYDIESLDSNLENLESRLKTIGAENSRYFLNHIEKAKFIIESFDSILKKNNLIKENILENYINFTKNNIESQKLENDKKKINHIKNIKEILSGLAFIEIFINGLSESSKIFHFQEQISKILQNTAFMRMILILGFIILYFVYYIGKYIFKKIIN
ncbi:MAG: hypothetical protein PHE25_00460 [Candidatus Gracilibacteria bacterium]|nr:hypothetical protein [Candidatus Gracilibacteria bacterium]